MNYVNKKSEKHMSLNLKLKLADKIGVAASARELKLDESYLYNWRSAIEKKSTTSEVSVAATTHSTRTAWW